MTFYYNHYLKQKLNWNQASHFLWALHDAPPQTCFFNIRRRLPPSGGSEACWSLPHSHLHLSFFKQRCAPPSLSQAHQSLAILNRTIKVPEKPKLNMFLQCTQIWVVRIAPHTLGYNLDLTKIKLFIIQMQSMPSVTTLLTIRAKPAPCFTTKNEIITTDKTAVPLICFSHNQDPWLSPLLLYTPICTIVPCLWMLLCANSF